MAAPAAILFADATEPLFIERRSSIEARKAELKRIDRDLEKLVQLGIFLKGDLAAMLDFAADKKKPPRERDGRLTQVSLVAGARNRLNLLVRAAA